MGSQNLLRLTATRCTAGPANHVPNRILLSPSRRVYLTVCSNSTHLQRLHTHQLHTKPLTRSSFITSKQPTSRTISTQQTTTTTSPSSAKPTRRRRYLLTLLTLTTLAITIHQSHKPDPRRATLNKDLFTPCTVLSNQPISQNAFLLTIQLPPSATNDAVIASAWRHGLWSVEVKQPQLQIARHYTPLPPPPSPGFDGVATTSTVAAPPTASGSPGAAQQLQFYVRQYDGGEVSTYLSRLRAGELIEIRGPHLGFDLGARLGQQEGEQGATLAQRRRKVVFLAGGTGVAPALQVAAYVLGRKDDDDVEVEILWASRSSVDCAGAQRIPVEKRRGWWSFSSSGGKKAVDERQHLEEEPSAVVRQIRELQAAYEKRNRKQLLEVKCAVDEEGSMIQAQNIMEAVGSAAQEIQVLASPSCQFHSQQQLEYSTEESDVSGNGSQGDGKKIVAPPQCTCSGEGVKGKNLLIVSGPDGFVSAYVGPKVWANGGERQGPVGGVVRGLIKDKPEIWKDWLVLKQ